MKRLPTVHEHTDLVRTAGYTDAVLAVQKRDAQIRADEREEYAKALADMHMHSNDGDNGGLTAIPIGTPDRRCPRCLRMFSAITYRCPHCKWTVR